MNINRILLLVLMILYLFAPVMADWIAAGGAQWYRPQLLWAGVIVTMAVALYRGSLDEP
jgi:hypothetical protein